MFEMLFATYLFYFPISASTKPSRATLSNLSIGISSSWGGCHVVTGNNYGKSPGRACETKYLVKTENKGAASVTLEVLCGQESLKPKLRVEIFPGQKVTVPINDIRFPDLYAKYGQTKPESCILRANGETRVIY